MEKTIEFIVIGGYLLLLIAVSLVFKRFNKDSNDYFRNGCRGKWWLIGSSAFMTAFSAWTFTGAAGVTYKAGWSVMIIYLANAFGFLLNALVLAPRFRQIRATTGAEVIRMRYGLATEQYVAYANFIFYAYVAALHLYGLCIFSSAIFGFNIQQTILIIGIVVIFYSMLGGSWAVKATDFLQSLILLPMTVLVAVLALNYIGGISEIFNGINAQQLTERFKILNTGEFQDKMIDFSIYWAIAMTLKNVINYNTLSAAPRYFAAKDGKEAQKAAWLACIMMLLGSLIWFVPPVVARLCFAADVDGVNISVPSEASYAVISLKLLPIGMSGLIAVAMFAATMSSMDSGLNGNAAVFVKNILPPLFRLAKKEMPDIKKQLFIGQIWTLFCGVLIVLIALYLSKQEGKGIFRYMLYVSLIIPTSQIPMLLGLFIKKVPWWSAIFTMIVSWPLGIFLFLCGKDFMQGVPVLEDPCKWHWGIMARLGLAAVAFCATMPFWKYASKAYKDQVNQFFKTMNTPVDFKKEVGEENDTSQENILGIFAMITGVAICLIMFIPGNSWGVDGRLGIFFVGGSVAFVGFLLYLSAREFKFFKKSEEKIIEDVKTEERGVVYENEPA